MAPPAEETGGRSGCGTEDDRRLGEGFPGRKPRPQAAKPRPLPTQVGLVLVWWCLPVAVSCTAVSYLPVVSPSQLTVVSLQSVSKRQPIGRDGQ